MTYLVAGLLLGIAGSAHCAGMCGPVLLAVNRAVSRSRRETLFRMLTYHAARVFMYVLLALPVGYAGERLAMAGLGRAIALIAGTLLIAAAAGATLGALVTPLSRAWSSFAIRAGTRAAAFTRRHPRAGYVVLGLANGLLPCGLLYAAATTSAALGTTIRAVVFMAGFGIGTVPVLIAVSLSAASIPVAVRQRFRAAVPAVMALAGILLIARGMLPVDHSDHQHHEPSILSHVP